MVPPASPDSSRNTRRRSAQHDDIPTVDAAHSQPHAHAHALGEPAAKRKKKNSNEPQGPPQRRQAACQQCRLRKVKCDKKRPTCTICLSGSQECKYLEEDTEKLTLESATNTLLDRFDQLRQELHDVKRLIHSKDLAAPGGLSPEASQRNAFLPQSRSGPLLNPQTQPQPQTQPATSPESSRDFLQIPPHRASADTVLRWPVFQGRYPRNTLIGNLFHQEEPAPHSPAPTSSSTGLITPQASLAPFEEERIPYLVDRFLQNVHTKNPILDVEGLVKHGRRCASQGVGWDASSCLVLLACALGSVARPFGRPLPRDSSIYIHNQDSPGVVKESSARLYARELEQGDSCFTLACRRLGSLKYSLPSAQCHFFAGVYLMYTLRPLDSWHYFLHASIFFQVHLKMTHGILGDFEEALATPSHAMTATGRKSKRLEQSLYWSCFKSECEFRVEMPLNQSEISLGEYPDLFPSPPSPITTTFTTPAASQSGERSTPYDSDHGQQRHRSYRRSTAVESEELELRQHAVRLCNEEESWYYYLTEIALRRIGNRIVNTFFRQERSSWLTNIKPLLHMAREFEAQVSSWSAHLPPAMQHYETTSIIRAPHSSFQNERDANHVSTELSWAIDNRLLEMQTWLYQPFLFYLIHSNLLSSAMQQQQQQSGSEPRISTLLNPFSPAASLSAHSMDSSTHPPRSGSVVASLEPEDVTVLKSLISSGIECCLKTIDVRSRGHRHHGLWYDLRSIMTAALVLLAIVKSGNAAWIPGGTETVWGVTATPLADGWGDQIPPVGGKIATVLNQFDFWLAELPDLARYKAVLLDVLEDVRSC